MKKKFTSKRDKNEKSQARIAVKLHFHMLLEAENWFNHLGKQVGTLSRVITMCILCETRILPLGICPKKIIQKKATNTKLFIITLFMINKN